MWCFIATARSTSGARSRMPCPPLAGEAKRRADAALAARRAPAPFDVAAAREEFAAMSAGVRMSEDDAFRERCRRSLPPTSTALIVDVEGFEGPLDLLLMLARQQKVDLSKISILALADQYLAFIEEARKVRLELAADYLVMAAWLAYLKSRLLLPEKRRASSGRAPRTWRPRLRCACAASKRSATPPKQLTARPQLGRDVFGRGAPEPIADIKRPEWTATLYDLLSAYAQQRQKSALAHRALCAAHRVVARRGARGAGAAGRRCRRTGAGSTNISHVVCGRAFDARDRDGVELRGGARNGARGRARHASGHGVRADLPAQAQRTIRYGSRPTAVQ